ncbi:MAG TPA: 4Fe-4S ferredoxin [Cyanobacteria bacterium UBA11149]|nr:4Fe-4S ferredoxin [Cyanobacteria bacterium UBA11367]HBE58424.1 4Fe-4S ferredoxin [Cyanobacteria bacterium UBA11366]HBR74596.1 4Fe-4S ferredoxin [Cyanobacteria bacterium UBA11159]HBS72632.1 4Fe-4S ferredoxin [Cyanobacteria bacterium UBA11153]HBW87563.1 4Fe-4S ferredoxin [Cyanobacteria bacterium UBA11149]
MTKQYYPLNSLREGHWFKLICGASYQHLPAIRNLALAYTLAGADCIDMAADTAVINAVKEALDVAAYLEEAAEAKGFRHSHHPLLMVSINDGEDPHFRKAEFNPNLCPADCPRPCEKICPAQAIVFPESISGEYRGQGNINREQSSQTEKRTKTALLPTPHSSLPVGVIDAKCYGCGRCVPICPYQLIYTRSVVTTPNAIAQIVLPSGVDAIEIHTKVGNFTDFTRLWRAIAPWSNQLKLLAISCPDGEGLIDYLHALYDLISPLPCPLIWQTDGRQMSGDISMGTTRAAVKLAQKVLAARLPGYVQLAGGTNDYTVKKLKELGLLQERVIGNEESRMGNGDKGDKGNKGDKGDKEKIFQLSPYPTPHIAGVAYGSYARVLLSPILDKLAKINEETIHGNRLFNRSNSVGHLEDFPELLWEAVATADSLVSQLKLRNGECQS